MSGALQERLREIDGAPFGAYRRIVGRHEVGEFVAIVDSVPPDPFAPPARVRLVVDRAATGLPPSLVETPTRKTAVEDYLARAARASLGRHFSRTVRGSGSGRISLQAPGPAMIERSACRITEHAIELRLLVDLPASRRRIRGRQATEIFLEHLPRVAISTLLFSTRQIDFARAHADLAEDHAFLQEELGRRGLVAFVADESLLARASGIDDSPRRDGREVAFVSPEPLAVTIELPRGGKVRGMGIPAGVTLIVGGAFHGKSTLLDAIAAAIHPHPPGDGRERVATIRDATVLVSEDGRSVRRADISGYLGALPSGVRSADFSTERASGSTSQAASLVEAVEIGTRLLLIDEDTAATNFMIRDGRMQRLIRRENEPIYPFVDRVRELHDRFGISTILVTGGSGDYLEVADTVIAMTEYLPSDATERARKVVEETRSMRIAEPVPPLAPPAHRVPCAPAPKDRRGRRPGVRGPRALRIDDETVDVSRLEQIAEQGQVRALARLVSEAARRMGEGKTLRALVEEIDGWLDG